MYVYTLCNSVFIIMKVVWVYPGHMHMKQLAANYTTFITNKHPTMREYGSNLLTHVLLLVTLTATTQKAMTVSANQPCTLHLQQSQITCRGRYNSSFIISHSHRNSSTVHCCVFPHA